MPFYRFGTGWVHMKFGRGKAPPQCRARIGAARRAGVLVPQHCCAIATLLCDGPRSSEGTCDMPLCSEHAHAVGPDKHLCPACFAARPQQDLPF